VLFVVLVGFFVLLMVVLALREVACWYWKINARLDRQDKLYALLGQEILPRLDTLLQITKASVGVQGRGGREP
jgi:hypothetical protein